MANFITYIYECLDAYTESCARRILMNNLNSLVKRMCPFTTEESDIRNSIKDISMSYLSLPRYCEVVTSFNLALNCYKNLKNRFWFDVISGLTTAIIPDYLDNYCKNINYHKSHISFEVGDSSSGFIDGVCY